MIRSVFFDLDDTLYDYTTAHETAMATLSAFAEGALGLSPQRFVELHSEAFRLQRERSGPCAATHSRLLRFQLMLEELGEPIGLAPVMEKLYWSALVACAKPLPGAIEALDQLRKMGLTVGIGTNMTADWQFEKLRHLDMLRRIDFLVTSEEAGVEKPDAGLFRLCAQKAGCAMSECAFVGDSLRGDVLGARTAGMRAIWLCRKPDDTTLPHDVIWIRGLSEVPALFLSFLPEGVVFP